MIKNTIRFRHQDLSSLRARLLEDLTREHWAILLGRSREVGPQHVITVYQCITPAPNDYLEQSAAFLRLRKDFVHRALQELLANPELDTIIDVHTHPFATTEVAFSSTDDGDEERWSSFLASRFEGIHYASIVLSQYSYLARIWKKPGQRKNAELAQIRTQTISEGIPCWRDSIGSQASRVLSGNWNPPEMFSRSAPLLGLDVLRRLATDQCIAIVGAGGLGSIISEHLVHMGFHQLILIDPDVLEVSNLNRVVGASYSDAQARAPKVKSLAAHLSRINPQTDISALQVDIRSSEAEVAIAGANWLVVATDNHTSRQHAQRLSIQYYVPLLSVGVNITVSDGVVSDMSGEVITARVGDNLCLNCLRRINPMKIAAESHPDTDVRAALVGRGYVTGTDMPEPAVKTLNSIVATLAVDTLINQYTETQRHISVLVYENNEERRIFEDVSSVENRTHDCFTCCV